MLFRSDWENKVHDQMLVQLDTSKICEVPVDGGADASQAAASVAQQFQAFLEKKGDEHAFSCLYLIAGIVCLYAAFSHGPEFCAMAPAAEVAKTAPALAAAAAPHRALLAQRVYLFMGGGGGLLRLVALSPAPWPWRRGSSRRIAFL